MSTRPSPSSAPIADATRAAVGVLLLLGAIGGIGATGVVAGDGTEPKSAGDSTGLAAAENATLRGTVADEDGTAVGDAIVLVVAGESPLVEKMTTTELVELANNEASDEVFVARTGSDGEYSLSLAAGTYRAIALKGDDASGIETIDHSGGATTDLDLTLHEHRPLTVRPWGGSASPGNETTVNVDLYNNGASAVEDLSYTLQGVPEGWTVVDHEDAGGSFDEGALRWTWASVPVGEFANPSVTFRVPDGTEIGNYTVTVVPESAHRSYDSVTATVRVHEPPTPGETPTQLPGGDGGGDGDANTTEPGPTTNLGDGSTATTTEPGEVTETTNGGGTPGPGVTVAVVGILVAVGGMIAIRRR
jgi:hypothetical protein